MLKFSRLALTVSLVSISLLGGFAATSQTASANENTVDSNLA